jgi:DNA invertase Pin-like site-specific DNA recombinase
VSTLRVSAMARVQQTTENQRRALDEVAERAAWHVVEIYADEISGTKGRKRPSPSQARSNVDSGVRRSLILR